MDCTLCKKPIEKYDANFNHFVIDESCSADICQSCIDKFFKWQGSLYAKLFPTTAMKKRFAGKKI
ncbi:Uncharacterised protein [uncultured archaeon]|nr:Uncharacterised protein [uncultured archaeon]